MKQNEKPWDLPLTNTTSIIARDYEKASTSYESTYYDATVANHYDMQKINSANETITLDKQYGLAKPARKYIRGDLKSD